MNKVCALKLAWLREVMTTIVWGKWVLLFTCLSFFPFPFHLLIVPSQPQRALEGVTDELKWQFILQVLKIF